MCGKLESRVTKTYRNYNRNITSQGYSQSHHVHLEMELPEFIRLSGLDGAPYYCEKKKQKQIERLNSGLLHRMAFLLRIKYECGTGKTLREVKDEVEEVGCWGMMGIGPASIKEFYKLLRIQGIKPFNARPI